MNTTAENIAFIIVRGIVALAIVGLGFYCIAQGIHFFALPRSEAEQIHIHFVGLDITASGLGAVIFATGLGLCFVGKRAAPKSIQSAGTSDTVAAPGTAPSQPPAPAPYTDTSTAFRRTTEVTTIAEGPRAHAPTDDML